MRNWIALGLIVPIIGCSTRDPEDTSGWFGAMGPLDEDVREPLEFTDEPYTFEGPGLASLNPLFEDFTRKYAPDAFPPDGDCAGWSTTNDLPIETWAMVTLLPRYYFKTAGCDFQSQGAGVDSDEKYYGNYFLEDQTGAFFVLNDSKVAHYDMGDRVKVRIRGVSSRFGLNAIATHEIIDDDRGPHPIHYELAGETVLAGQGQWEYVDESVIGKVLRAEGIVQNDPDTFGQFTLLDDNGYVQAISLDAEINRRGIRFPVGTRLRATGPVHNAFGHKIVIMRVGQLEVID